MNQIEELIYFFTHNKNLTKKHLAKRDELLARDVVTSQKATIKIPSRKPDSQEGHRSGVKSVYINPKGLKQFLLDFNQDERN